MKKFLLALGFLLALAGPGLAQKTQSALSTENSASFPSCATNCITAAQLRAFNLDMINSNWNLLNPPVSGVAAGTYGPGFVTLTIGADGRITAAATPTTVSSALSFTATGTALTIGSTVGSGTTPTQIGFDTSTSSVAGSNPKIALNGTGYGLGLYGFGVSAGSLDYLAPTGANHTFWINGVSEVVVTTSQLTINQLPNFAQNAPGATCTATGSINILVQGVAKKLNVC